MEQPVQVVFEITLAGTYGVRVAKYDEHTLAQRQAAVGNVAQNAVNDLDRGGFIAVNPAREDGVEALTATRVERAGDLIRVGGCQFEHPFSVALPAYATGLDTFAGDTVVRFAHVA